MQTPQANKFFIQVYDHSQPVMHGGIGNIDIERNLIHNNYKPISFPFRNDFSLKAKMVRFGYLLKTLLSLPQGSVVVFQYPIYAYLEKLLIRFLLVRKSIKIICFITDINGIRDDEEELLLKEIIFFKKFNYLIVHNSVMKEWIKSRIDHAQIIEIEFFDFFSTTCSQRKS